MTSIDELFKKAGVPSKRKLYPIRDPSEMYKSAKYNSRGQSSRQAHVQDEQQEEDDGDDQEAGPAFPPERDAEAGSHLLPDDDDEGRFFGGGITDSQAQVLDYVEGASEKNTSDLAKETKFDVHWLRRTIVTFEKRINKNAEQRAKFACQPEKFIQSEADLDQSVRDLAALAQLPDLFLEFVSLGSVSSLVGLLAHENADIAVAAIETIAELMDEDVAATEEQWEGLVNALLDADLLGLVRSNFSRLDESDDADRDGVYHGMSLLESLCSVSWAAERVGKHEELVRWLVSRAGREEEMVGQNKQYAAEIIAILVASGRKNREKLAEMNAVDTFLQLAAAYRKRDPEKGGEEEEFVGNVFEALTSMVDTPVGKAKFVDAEGVELALIMLKEGKMSKSFAVRMLAHATEPAASLVGRGGVGGGAGGGGGGGGGAAAEVCKTIVQAGGLKTLFTNFMRKKDALILEQLLEIMANMLRLLPGESPERIRTLAKFVEKDYEKISKLVDLRRGYSARLKIAEEQIKEDEKHRWERRRRHRSSRRGGEKDLGDEQDEEENQAFEFEALSRRLDAGLFALQLVDTVLAWLAAEDDGARRTIVRLLRDLDEGLADLKKTLEQQIQALDSEDEGAKELGEVLGTLVQFLS